MSYLICEICGKTSFKSKAGLVGHKKIVHGIDTRKTLPDDIGRKLDALNVNLFVLSSLFFRSMKGLVKEQYLEKNLKELFREHNWEYKPVLKALRLSMKQEVTKE